MAAPVSVPLLDHFAALSDPRQGAVSVTGNPASGFGCDHRGGGRLRRADAVGNRASGVPQVLLVEEFRRAGAEAVFFNRMIGTSAEDDLLLQVQGVIAEYERAKILERDRRGVVTPPSLER